MCKDPVSLPKTLCPFQFSWPIDFTRFIQVTTTFHAWHAQIDGIKIQLQPQHRYPRPPNEVDKEPGNT